MNTEIGEEDGLQPSIYGWIHKDYIRLSTISRTATPKIITFVNNYEIMKHVYGSSFQAKPVHWALSLRK
jgi:hypothetical protein